MLHKEIPFLRIIVPLCLGVIAGMFSRPEPLVYIMLIIFVVSGFIISLLYNDRLENYIFGVSVSIAFFTSGLIMISKEKASVSTLEPVQATYLATLSDYPVEKEKTFMATLKLERVLSDGVYKSIGGSIVLYHRKDSIFRSYKPGDLLTIKFTPIEIANRGNPCEFNYKSFMESKGIRYYAFTGKWNITGKCSPEHRKLKYSALIARERIIQMFKERGISEERLALVSAITLGQKSLLEQDTKQIFINAGVMHIMAVSGLHAVILSLFIFNMLFFLKGRFNILRILITIVLLWAFAFITGLSPSVLRATLMFSFLQAGNLMKRKVNGINSVLASAFVLIIIKPSVITDAGFLLSYSAVIYIIGFYQDLYLRLDFKSWLPDKIWQSTVVTLVAQAGTLPLTVTLFNRFPVYFILTNVIIVPLSSLLIILGCLVPLTYYIVPVSEFLASILDRLTGLTEFLTETAASLPWSTIGNIGMTSVECILLTIALSLLTAFLVKNRPFSIKYPLAAFIIVIIAVNLKITENGKTNQLIVYNNPLSPFTGIKKGNTLYIIGKNDTVPAEVTRHAAVRGLEIKKTGFRGNPVLIRASDKMIMITDSVRGIWLEKSKPDILILIGIRPFIERNIPLQNIPETIIVSSECFSGYRLPLSDGEINKRTISFVRKSGAYISAL